MDCNQKWIAVGLAKKWIAVILLEKWIAVALAKKWIAAGSMKKWIAVALAKKSMRPAGVIPAGNKKPATRARGGLWNYLVDLVAGRGCEGGQEASSLRVVAISASNSRSISASRASRLRSISRIWGVMQPPVYLTGRLP